MRLQSILALLLCIAVVSSIVIPGVGARLDAGKSNIYKDILNYGIEFKDSKIQSHLMEELKSEKDKDTIKDVLIVLKQGTSKNSVQTLLTEGNNPLAVDKKTKYLKSAHTFSAKVKSKDIETLADMNDVEKIYDNYRIKTTLDDSVPIIKANALWSKYDGTGITVAVVDTGVDANHPDLRGKVIDEVSFVEDEGTEDGFGHGTHVAGIIAGTGFSSNSNYKGVAPGASLMNVKVLGNYGYGTASSVIEGIEYAVDNGANIISMSLGGGTWPSDGSDPVSMAANAAVDAGVVVVVAAGNSGAPFLILSPGAAQKVITVGASTKMDTMAEYSSQGPAWPHRFKPEVVAPGGAANMYLDPAGLGIVSVKSAGSLLDLWYPDYSVDKYYVALSGTSMATPHVSGVAALMLQAYPQLTPEAIKQRLMNTGADLGYNPISQGAGRIDAVLAVNNTIRITPMSLSYTKNTGTNTKETIKITNNGEKKVTLTLSNTGDLNVKFSIKKVTINPGQTSSIIATIQMPAGITTGLHAGNIVVYNGSTLTARLPILEDTPMTFVHGKSEFNDKIKIKSTEFFPRGTNYYYFNVPKGVPGISSTLNLMNIQAYVDMYLINPDGEFVDYVFGDPNKKSATVSAMNPKPGKWMILLDSWAFDTTEVPITLTTYLNSIKLAPSLWSPDLTISTGSSITQEFTVTNTGSDDKSVHVDAYINTPNTVASGSFSGEVSYVENNGSMNSHTYVIPDGSSQYTFTLNALDNNGYIFASIYDPNGMWVNSISAGYWASSSASVKINDPMPGSWRADIQMLYAPNDTTEHYRGDYAIVSKNMDWITNEPDTLFILGSSDSAFISTLTPPEDANGHYTGELTVSAEGELLTVPISINAGKNISYPGDFSGDIQNKAWRYYNININSDQLNVSINWDNIESDLDLFVFDPSGKTVASSTLSNTTSEAVNVSGPVSGTWTIGVYGYKVAGIQDFTGTLN